MIRVLWSGVDTLEASFRGELTEPTVEALEAAKDRAQASEVPEPFLVRGLKLYVAGSGLKPWRYLLKHEDLHLRLSPSERVPTVSARLLASGLAWYGHENLYQLAAALAEELGARPAGLSRLDLAVDFQGFEPTVSDMASVVCPAPFRPVYPNLEHPETFQYGRGDMVVRVYNKRRESATTGKRWLRVVWGQNEAYDATRDVWRFEGQFRRPILRALDCTNPEHAFARLDGLLGFALAWCCLRVPEGKNKTRWPVDLRWEELGRAAFAGEPIPRVKVERAAASFARTIPQAVGLLTSGAAALLLFDFDQAADLWKREMRAYIEASDEPFAVRVAKRRRRTVG